MATCKEWLRRELELVRPTVVVSLGRTPTVLFLKDQFSSMGKAVGTAYPLAFLGSHGILVPIYHPSYLLRGNMEQVKDMVRLFVRVKDYIEKVGAR